MEIRARVMRTVLGMHIELQVCQNVGGRAINNLDYSYQLSAIGCQLLPPRHYACATGVGTGLGAGFAAALAACAWASMAVPITNLM
jgi:hypothetical protein